jgi:TetR/AcrR family transcriptional regulator, transcriptional repressor for nem operon
LTEIIVAERLTPMMIIIIIAQRVSMRISKAQVEENRNRVVTAASELFRARGFESVSVADVTRAAGFTHGGFYNHFDSKEALAAEAVTQAWAAMAAHRARAAHLSELLSSYLSPAARSAPGKACPAAALAGDVRRQPEGVRRAFVEGLEDMIADLEARIGGDAETRRSRAVAVATRMIGAVILSRAAPDGTVLAEELLSANLAAALEELAS